MRDTGFFEQRKVFTCCDNCGECYYVEASQGETLEGWKFCALCCFSNVLTISPHKNYAHRNGDLEKLSCGECSRKFYLGNINKAENLYCGFCGSKIERSN